MALISFKVIKGKDIDFPRHFIKDTLSDPTPKRIGSYDFVAESVLFSYFFTDKLQQWKESEYKKYFDPFMKSI